LWLGEQGKFTITPVATRTSRGINTSQRKALRGITDAFGPGPKDKMHWGHPPDQTHGTTPAGRSPALRPQPGSENSSLGATDDKATKAEAKRKGLFTRDSKSTDVTAPKGKRYAPPGGSQKPAWQQVMEDYEKTIAQRKPPVRVPRATGTPPSTAAPHEQLELPFEKPVPPPEAPAGGVGAVGKVAGFAGAAGMVGDALVEAHEGHPGQAIIHTGEGVGAAYVFTKVPALVPIAVMVSTIDHYDADVKRHSNSLGERVEDFTGIKVLGGVTASVAATGESLFQGTFGVVGRGIGKGAAVLYIRATSDDYTFVPWKSQIWADIFD
jgi:hypothetical protein